MKKLILLFFLLTYFQTHAQKMGRKEVIEDLAVLAGNIQDYNPALPHYHPEFDSLSALVIKDISNDSVSIFDYYSAVSRVCALAGEGHFKVGDRNERLRKALQGLLSIFLSYVLSCEECQTDSTYICTRCR